MGDGSGKEIRYSDEGGGNAHTLVSTIFSENGSGSPRAGYIRRERRELMVRT
jgi:hypothetical protein